jgi:hypothetical protein
MIRPTKNSCPSDRRFGVRNLCSKQKHLNRRFLNPERRLFQ